MRQLAAVILQVFSFSVAAAIPSQCIEDPKRQIPCENLIFKSIFKDNKTKLICFCKSDFKELFITPADETEAVLQKMKWREIESSLGMSKEEILALMN